MRNRRNYYRLLQVQPDAPLEIIRASYRTHNCYSRPEKKYSAKILDLSPWGIRFMCVEELSSDLTVKLSSPLLKAVAGITNIQNKKLKSENYFTIGDEFLSVAFAGQKGLFVSLCMILSVFSDSLIFKKGVFICCPGCYW